MSKYESIAITPKTKSVIKRLAKKHEMNIIECAEAMASYFDKTGVNPRDEKVLSPAEELKKFRDTIISFMRKQEKDFILPVFGKMDVTLGRFVHYLEHEAPRKTETGALVLEEGQGGGTGEKASSNEQIDSEILRLKGELSQQKLRNEELKKGVVEIFNKSDYKSTGLTKKIVIDMPQYEFGEIRNLIARM